MRTITTVKNIYKFEELLDNAKAHALERLRNTVETWTTDDEVKATRKAFKNLIWGATPKEDITGLRLRTYIINTFWDAIYTPKYYFVRFEKSHPIKHDRIKTNYSKHYKHYWFSYYSGCQVECSCPLTGVAWDVDVLKPMLDLIEYKAENRKTLDVLDWDTLIKDCYASLDKAREDQVEYLMSDEALMEDIQNGDYEFYEDGTKY